MAGNRKAPFRFWSFFFSLKGRVSLWPFLALIIPVRLVTFVSGEILRHSTRNVHAIAPLLSAIGLFELLTLWPTFAVLFKRFHNANTTGLWALVPFAPFAYGIYRGIEISIAVRHGAYKPAPPWHYEQWIVLAIVWVPIIVATFLPASKGTNRFGPPPGQLPNLAEDVF